MKNKTCKEIDKYSISYKIKCLSLYVNGTFIQIRSYYMELPFLKQDAANGKWCFIAQ